MHRGRWRLAHRDRAPGISGVIATVFLVAITLIAGVVLWTFRFNLPSPPVSFSYTAQGGLPESAFGDGTDCTTINGGQVCATLPATFVVISSHVPAAIPLKNLVFDFVCNNTRYLHATLDTMEWVPNTNGNPGPGAPKLGTCGAYDPSVGGTKVFFNRVAIFQQVTPGSTVLANGDTLIIFDKTFLCLPAGGGPPYNCDEDFHGIPPWCLTIPNACTLNILYQTSNYLALVANIPMTILSSYGCPPECGPPVPPAGGNGN